MMPAIVKDVILIGPSSAEKDAELAILPLGFLQFKRYGDWRGKTFLAMEVNLETTAPYKVTSFTWLVTREAAQHMTTFKG